MIDIQADNWLGELLPHVVALAREAGQVIMAMYGEENPSVERKPDNSPLTRADLASHQVILNGLSQLSPDWPVLSEESAEIPFDERQHWCHFWMVDPLDGTKEFLRRNGEFTVNIALMEGNAPILGVVYAPVIGNLYFAAKGAGAYRIDGEITARIKASRAADATARTVVSRSHRSQEEDLDRFTGGAGNCEFIAMGSSLKFCLVAEGWPIFIPAPAQPWNGTQPRPIAFWRKPEDL